MRWCVDGPPRETLWLSWPGLGCWGLPGEVWAPLDPHWPPLGWRSVLEEAPPPAGPGVLSRCPPSLSAVWLEEVLGEDHTGAGHESTSPAWLPFTHPATVTPLGQHRLHPDSWSEYIQCHHPYSLSKYIQCHPDSLSEYIQCHQSQAMHACEASALPQHWNLKTLPKLFMSVIYKYVGSIDNILHNNQLDVMVFKLLPIFHGCMSPTHKHTIRQNCCSCCQRLLSDREWRKKKKKKVFIHSLHNPKS